MKMKFLIIACLSLLSGNSSCSGGGEGNGGEQTTKITVVKPTVQLGSQTEDVTKLQLKPGKLVSLNQVNEANCKRAVAAGMCLDIIVSDDIINEAGMTDEKLEQKISDSGTAVKKVGADLWGMHLPYSSLDISAANESSRSTTVAKLKGIIEMCLKHLGPKHFVIHPSTGTIYTTSGDFDERKTQSRQSLRELQAFLAECNTVYGTTAILCVENCPRSIGYDAPSLLDLLSADGLEDVRICLDTGQALIPLNREYNDPVKNGDALDALKKIGTRLGTLHIQQNVGAEGQTGTLDKHLEPFNSGLIGWGEFYYELLKNNLYRGCFLYEVSYVDTYGGTGSTIETSKTNYTAVIYPAYQAWLEKNNPK